MFWLVWTDLKRLSDVVSEEVIKKKVYEKLNLKVNNLEKKIPDASTIIQLHQYTTDKQNMEKKIGEVKNKIPDLSDWVTTAVLNTNICEAETKTPGIIGLTTTSVLNTKIEEVENKFMMLLA